MAITAQPARSERQIRLGFIALSALLVMAVVLALLSYWRTTAPAPVAPAPDALASAQAKTEKPLAALQREEMVLRPLFWQSRRAVFSGEAEQDVQANEEDVPDELKDLTVLGTFSDGAAGGMIVLFKNTRQRVAVGESVAGWELERVSAEKVVMRRDARRSDVPLKRELGGAKAKK